MRRKWAVCKQINALEAINLRCFRKKSTASRYLKTIYKRHPEWKRWGGGQGRCWVDTADDSTAMWM